VSNDSPWHFLTPTSGDPSTGGEAPSFSVIIAAYNVASVIGEAIDSVLGQTVQPHEIVVCDDGSRDDLASALVPYAGRIKLLKKRNGGEGSAKNAAARACSGDFVAILDADDLYLPCRLEALADLAAARPDLDILTTDAFLEVAGDRVRRCYTSDWQFETGRQRAGILERNFIFGHVAVRRERFLAAGGFDETIRWTTDWDCWIRMILGGARAGCVAEPLAVYRVHEDSLSAQRARLVAGRLQTLEKTEARSDLSRKERGILGETTSRYRRELALLELRTALREGRDDARARAFLVARDRSFSVRVRLNAVAAAILPTVAGRRERRRTREHWIGAGGTHVARN